MNQLKYALAKKLVSRSVKKSDFDRITAETNIVIDPTVPEYNNSYYFTGHGGDGSAFMIRVAGRGTGKFEVWFSFHLPGKGSFSIPTNVQDGVHSFDESPMKLECLEPEKRWALSFSGEVDGPKGPARAEFSAEFHSDYPIFHFTNDMNPAAHARAMAAEKWTGEWFKSLQDMHQHHYEQGGSVSGTLTVDGEEHGLDMRYVRDHSFGPRSWGAMERHLWLTVCLDNGDFCNVSLPEYTFLKMTGGFYAKDGSYVSVVDSSSFGDIAPEGKPAKEFSYWMKLEGGERLEVTCRQGAGFTWLMDGIYRVIEWVSDFEIDGVHGRGICEFGFNVDRYDYGSL